MRRLLDNTKVRQVGSLYMSMFFGLIIGIAISVVNTRFLGPQQYGDFKFLTTLFRFIMCFFTLGLFVSGSRLLAQRKNEAMKHELFANLLLLAAIISILFAIALFGFSSFQESVFDNQLGETIRMFSPLLFVYPFQLCIEKIMQGDNRIYALSVFRLSPKICYLVAVLLFNYFIPLKLAYALGIQFATLGLTICLASFFLKPNFKNIKKNVSMIWKENRAYGFQVYIGIIAATVTGQLGVLSVSYFVDNTNVGFYSLARTITMPLTMIPSVVGTTFFKEFANRKAISRKITIMTLFLSISTLLGFFLIIKKVILLLYSEEFGAVVPLAYLVAIGSIFLGFADYIGKFLNAHGKGKQIRNAAIIVGIANVLGYIVLVDMYGVTGAALTNVLSGLIFCTMMSYYYRKYQKELALPVKPIPPGGAAG